MWCVIFSSPSTKTNLSQQQVNQLPCCLCLCPIWPDLLASFLCADGSRLRFCERCKRSQWKEWERAQNHVRLRQSNTLDFPKSKNLAYIYHTATSAVFPWASGRLWRISSRSRQTRQPRWHRGSQGNQDDIVDHRATKMTLWITKQPRWHRGSQGNQDAAPSSDNPSTRAQFSTLQWIPDRNESFRGQKNQCPRWNLQKALQFVMYNCWEPKFKCRLYIVFNTTYHELSDHSFCGTAANFFSGAPPPPTFVQCPFWSLFGTFLFGLLAAVVFHFITAFCFFDFVQCLRISIH